MAKPTLDHLKLALTRLFGFSRRVLYNFRRHKGLLLAGSVAYNTLLSIVPMFAVAVVLLSHVVDEQALLSTTHAELSMLAPSHADALTEQIALFIRNRDVLGVFGGLVLLFFSSLAFRILADAMSVIFNKPRAYNPRHPWLDAAVPYLYVLALGVGVGGITLLRGLMDGLSEGQIRFLGLDWTASPLPGLVLYGTTLFSLLFMITSIYMVLPPRPIRFKRAFAGGAIATALWEITRHVLVWYFTNISLVNVVYGSLATVIILLLTAEIGAVIILLGAEVIAEIEHAGDAGLRWYDDPRYLATPETTKAR